MKSVLIADDSEKFRSQLRKLLADLGFKVIAEASDGLEAIDFYVRYRPELVTLDFVMPQLDGLAALREIKKYNPQANVVIISSCLSQKTKQEAEKLGVWVCVDKPIDLPKLQDALARMEDLKKVVPHG